MFSPSKVLPPAALKTIKAGLSIAALYTLFSVALKGIGSAFRLNDLREAPKPVFNDRLKQETGLLLMVGLVTLPTQVLLPLAFKKFNVASEVGKNIVRSIMIAPGYIASELASRQVGDVSWEGMMASVEETIKASMMDDPTSRAKLDQLIAFLYKPNTTHGDNVAQAFGGGSIGHQYHNPANQLNVVSGLPAASPLKPRVRFQTNHTQPWQAWQNQASPLLATTQPAIRPFA